MLGATVVSNPSSVNRSDLWYSVPMRMSWIGPNHSLQSADCPDFRVNRKLFSFIALFNDLNASRSMMKPDVCIKVGE